MDGRVAAPGTVVDAATAEVLIDGIPLPVNPSLVYYLLHKPPGVISTTRDPQGRTTVVDLAPREPRVYPVGRLDADTTGLLLLTNDGDFAELVAHPRFGVVKVYEALVDGTPTRRDLAAMCRGVDLEDGPARPVSVRSLGAGRRRAHLEISMREGRNREVRRLCEAAGFPVVRLHRSAIGPLRDASLRPGEWRRLAVDEIRAFYGAGASTPGRRAPRGE